MERLRTLAVLVILGTGCHASFGSNSGEPDPPAKAEAPEPAVEKAATPEKLPDPPVPPLKYLETGARLFNKGRFDLASKYFSAARMYRDRLSDNERVVLDVYQEKLEHYTRELREAEEAPAPVASDAATTPDCARADRPVDADVTSTSTAGTAPPGAGDARVSTPAQVPGDHGVGRPEAAAGPGSSDTRGPGPADDPAHQRPQVPGTETLRGTADTKQKARWLLQLAREQIFRHQYDAADRSIAEVKGMDVRWGFFDDTPVKVAETLAKARANAAQGGAPGPGTGDRQPRDRRAARSKLREARSALAAGETDKAETIAREVRSWNLRYGLLDDTPDKVAAAVGERRRREAVRNAEFMVRSYIGSGAGGPDEPRAATPEPVPPENTPTAPR